MNTHGMVQLGEIHDIQMGGEFYNVRRNGTRFYVEDMHGGAWGDFPTPEAAVDALRAHAGEVSSMLGGSQ